MRPTSKAFSLCKLRGQIFAWLGLLFISSTILPFSLLHNHDEDNLVCVKGDLKLEEDPCHARIYHHFSDKKECAHPSHLVKKTFNCKVCEFSRTFFAYIIPKKYFFKSFYDVNEVIGFYKSLSQSFDLQTFFNKGPPFGLSILF